MRKKKVLFAFWYYLAGCCYGVKEYWSSVWTGYMDYCDEQAHKYYEET